MAPTRIISTRRTLLSGGTEATNLLSGIVAHWTLDEASGQRNDSYGANHLTDNNTVTQNPGKVGNAAQFTAANLEYLSIADNAALSLGTSDFTVAGWLYVGSSPAGNRYVWAKGTGTAAATLEYRLQLTSATNTLDWSVSNGAVVTTVNASNYGTIPTSTWIFVVCWRDTSTDKIGISVNNGLANLNTHVDGNQDTAGNFRLGIRVDATSLPWDGRLDAISVYRRLLNSAEKSRLYNNGFGLSYGDY